MKGLQKPNNVVEIKTSLNDFFHWWCVFLKPIISLTNREADVVSSFLKFRYEMSKSISDPAILDILMLNNDTKKRIMAECNISQSHFYGILNKLKKNKVFIGNTLNPRLIPNIKKDEENGYFQLLLLFNMK